MFLRRKSSVRNRPLTHRSFPAQVSRQLQLHHRDLLESAVEPRLEGARRFLCPLRDCSFVLNSILDDLPPDRGSRYPTDELTRHTEGVGGGGDKKRDSDHHDRTQPKGYGVRKNAGSTTGSATTIASGGSNHDVPFDPIQLRPQRCTGAALAAAVSLLECLLAAASPGSGGAGTGIEAAVGGSRVFLLTSGPCTVGPGRVVGLRKSEPMRSWHDLQKGNSNTTYTQPAIDFYDGLAERCVRAGVGVDLLGGSLDH